MQPIISEVNIGKEVFVRELNIIVDNFEPNRNYIVPKLRYLVSLLNRNCKQHLKVEGVISIPIDETLTMSMVDVRNSLVIAIEQYGEPMKHLEDLYVSYQAMRMLLTYYIDNIESLIYNTPIDSVFGKEEPQRDDKLGSEINKYYGPSGAYVPITDLPDEEVLKVWNDSPEKGEVKLDVMPVVQAVNHCSMIFDSLGDEQAALLDIIHNINAVIEPYDLTPGRPLMMGPSCKGVSDILHAAKASSNQELFSAIINLLTIDDPDGPTHREILHMTLGIIGDMVVVDDVVDLYSRAKLLDSSPHATAVLGRDYGFKVSEDGAIKPDRPCQLPNIESMRDIYREPRAEPDAVGKGSIERHEQLSRRALSILEGVLVDGEFGLIRLETLHKELTAIIDINDRVHKTYVKSGFGIVGEHDMNIRMKIGHCIDSLKVRDCISNWPEVSSVLEYVCSNIFTWDTIGIIGLGDSK